MQRIVRVCQRQLSYLLVDGDFLTELEVYWKKLQNRVLCHPLEALGVTYTVHLWLVVKRVVDFLLVLIELFSLALTVEAL